jgi:hypothetical protein
VSNSAGVVLDNGGTYEAASSQFLKRATVNTGGVLRLAAGTNVNVLTVGDNTATYADAASSHLNVNGGKVDVAGGGMIVDYAPGSDANALAYVKAKVAAGFNAGDWQGPGLTSSNVIGDPTGSKGVGYALSSDILGPTGGTFLGSAADGDAVLVRYTLLGDATLNGAVDFNDLVQLAQNYNVVDGSRTWFTGDFTYDGNTDFNDLVKLAQNYNASLPTDPIPGAPVDFQADLAAAFASVPEPGALSLLGLAACGLAGRRRRRSK